jgi:7-cyano-7-deazaguanine synthase
MYPDPAVAADTLHLADVNAPLAVLVSGGLDSAILVGEALRFGAVVHPLYVRTGLLWETVELEHLSRYLNALRSANLRPLHILELPVADLYPSHWSLTGQNTPDADSPDEAVFLPGRNVLLLAKAILWCHLRQIPAVALAPLAGNPFSDATPEFFRAYEAIVNQAVRGSVRVLRPYADLRKNDVMRRAGDLPLGLTFSCIRPVGQRHCGRCNKCAERRRAFLDAGMSDPTAYARESL